MKFLAAHSIQMAAHMNPTGVFGLNMVLCRNSGSIERLSDEEIEDLKRRSDSLDEEIRAILLP
jgi:hypothetical protein